MNKFYNSIESLSVEKYEEFENKNETTSKKGLGVIAASIFIAGEMAGSGVLALPKAIVNTGGIGMLLLPLLCFNAGYSGVKLGNCWNIIEERYPQHRCETRNPYATIASIALGKWASLIVSNSIRITLFGAGTVYLLLASQIFRDLIVNVFPVLSSCVYFLILAILLAPPMWLGSPKHFSFVGIGAMLTTAVACILYLIQMMFDASEEIPKVVHRQHDFADFFLAFGTLLFAFGGASTFPTIQNDMHKKDKFGTSVIIAFVFIITLYVPIALGGYALYGEKVAGNIASSLTKSVYVQIGNILMAVHLVFAFLIVINPVCQDIEEAADIPKHFGWKRCLVRVLMIIVMIMIGETIPKFDKILSLIGGSTITLLTFVFPPYMYMKLCSQESDAWETRHIPLYEKVYLWELIGIGVIGGTAATYSAVMAIFGDSFSRPCYWPS